MDPGGDNALAMQAARSSQLGQPALAALGDDGARTPLPLGATEPDPPDDGRSSSPGKRSIRSASAEISGA